MSPDRVADLGIPGLQDPVRIGVGGFAVVYRAFQPTFKRPVAVKVITAEIDDRTRRRFQRECEALGVLSEHPGIVTVHDAGFTPEERPYLVMAYLAGGSLSERIQRDGPMDWRSAVGLGGVVANALAAAHQTGVIHCDIKPGNVLTTADGTPQLADFGIARIAGDQVTRTSSVTASLPYAAPEILSGQPPTPESDVYALGATLHELITGEPAFGASPDEALAGRLRRIMEEPPRDLRALGVPGEVAAFVGELLAKDAQERPESAAEVARSLQELSREHGISATELQGPPSGDVAETQPIDSTAVVPAPHHVDYATVAVPGTGYVPSHRVPWTGMHAWSSPDVRQPVAAVLDPDLDVAVLGWYGEWAQVQCSNGWRAWVDGRLLVPIWG